MQWVRPTNAALVTQLVKVLDRLGAQQHVMNDFIQYNNMTNVTVRLQRRRLTLTTAPDLVLRE